MLTSIGHRTPTRPIFNAVLSQRLTLIVSTSILLEYEEIIAQRTTPALAQNLLEALGNLRSVNRHEVRYNWRLPFIDSNDQKFVDAYIAGQADYLVSNDRHFGELAADGFPQVRVVSAAGFMEILTNSI